MADRAALNAAADPISMMVDLGALRKNYQTLKNAVGHQTGRGRRRYMSS